jgi:ABC-2 type transport system permease protein
VAIAGVSAVEFLVAALGALAVTGEYPSGLIRVTLAAVPRRVPVLIAKAGVVGAVAALSGLIGVLAAFLTARLILVSAGLPATAGASAVLGTAGSAGVYLAGVALIGTGFGWVVRSTVGALAAFFGIMYLPPLLVMLLPAGIGPRLAGFLPSNAGAALLHASATEPATAAPAALVLGAWVSVLLVVAARVLRHRDA